MKNKMNKKGQLMQEGTIRWILWIVFIIIAIGAVYFLLKRTTGQ